MHPALPVVYCYMHIPFSFLFLSVVLDFFVYCICVMYTCLGSPAYIDESSGKLDGASQAFDDTANKSETSELYKRIKLIFLLDEANVGHAPIAVE